MGPAGEDVRDAFTEGFQKKYPGIEVDYNGMAGAQVAPKLLNELSAGVYRTDSVIAGTITAIESLIPANAIVPIQPYLVGPESQDLSKWKGGKFDFSDNAEKYNLVFGNRLQVAFVYNRDLVPSRQDQIVESFLSPEWKGRSLCSIPPRWRESRLGDILVHQRVARLRQNLHSTAVHHTGRSAIKRRTTALGFCRARSLSDRYRPKRHTGF